MISYLLMVQVCTMAHGCQWQSSGLLFQQEQWCVVKGLSLSLDRDVIDLDGFRCVQRQHEPVPLPRPRPR